MANLVKKYNHAFSLAFSVVTNASCTSENDSDYPEPSEIREAVLKRLARLDDNELMEAVGAPFDSFEAV